MRRAIVGVFICIVFVILWLHYTFIEILYKCYDEDRKQSYYAAVPCLEVLSLLGTLGMLFIFCFLMICTPFFSFDMVSIVLDRYIPEDSYSVNTFFFIINFFCTTAGFIVPCSLIIGNTSKRKMFMTKIGFKMTPRVERTSVISIPRNSETNR
ncbi:unnamed protein product [Caenorhabditis auriculariae]|uniref:Uncharacterized protein n=1 Tax=Caenorhabditis auriculariae TaxID=2777116 RepID=A0A8S1HBC0_9PELO|nr:unnamed protein product [Caenorhabditis auriculariae]